VTFEAADLLIQEYAHRHNTQIPDHLECVLRMSESELKNKMYFDDRVIPPRSAPVESLIVNNMYNSNLLPSQVYKTSLPSSQNNLPVVFNPNVNNTVYNPPKLISNVPVYNTNVIQRQMPVDSTITKSFTRLP
jgi:hypothetical protein